MADSMEQAMNQSRRTITESEIQSTVQEIVDKAARAGIDPELYLYYQTVYFQVDASAYTYDARSESRRAEVVLDFLFDRNSGASSSDHSLFSFSAEKARLLFAPELEAGYGLLVDAIRQRNQVSPPQMCQ
jgi:hypothetical protein